MSIRPKTQISIPSEAEDVLLMKAAQADPDAQPLTDAQLAAMKPLKNLRGRPKSAQTKTLVSIRYNPEVIDFFKSTGDGWQSRMNEVLTEYVHKHS